MNSTQGVIEATNALFMAIKGEAIQSDLYFYSKPIDVFVKEMLDTESAARHKIRYEALKDALQSVGADAMPAGALYVMQFNICVSDYIKRPGMIDAMLQRPRIFKQLSSATVQKYAAMNTDDFAQLLYDTATDKGRKLTPADDEKNGYKSPQMMERCLYAAYIYTQVAAYLDKQNATFLPVPMPNGIMQMPWINTGIIDYDENTKNRKVTIGDTVITARGKETKPATIMLFLYLLYKAKDTGSETVFIPLQEYAEVRKRSTAKPAMQKFRAEVLEQLAELKTMGYDGFTYSNGKKIPAGFIDYCGGTAIIVNGSICWSFNPALFKRLFIDLPEDVPRELFSLNLRKYANAFYFGLYIAQNWRLNEDKPGRREKITMRTLISKSPELPTEEEVKKSNGNYSARIVRPVFDNLDALETVGYDFYTAEGEMVDNPDALDYQTFINGYIMVNYEEYPQHTDFIVNKRKNRQKRKDATEKGALKGIAKAAEKLAQEGS